MLRPSLRVVRPLDGAGMLAHASMAVLTVLALIAVLLSRLPVGVVELFGSRLLVRVAILLVILWALAWIRAVVYSLLPTAAYLLGRRLKVPGGTGRVAVAVDQVVGLLVDRRPAPVHQVLQVELRDGRRLDVCPMHWPGAGRVYAGLRKRVPG